MAIYERGRGFELPDNREQQVARAGFETGGTAGLRVTVTVPPLTNTFILSLYCLISWPGGCNKAREGREGHWRQSPQIPCTLSETSMQLTKIEVG